MPAFAQLFVTDPAGATGHRPRPQGVPRPQAHRARAGAGDRHLLPVAVVAHARLQGDADDAAAGGSSSPTCIDERFESALLLVHSRFSTNTFPSWPLAHPYRYVAHNGEINTVQGNQNWMRAREAMLDGSVLPGIDRAFPICTPGASDTARFDEVLELLHLGGRPIHHAVLMMIPEAWENNAEMDPAQRAFYRFHSSRDGAVGRPGQRRLHRRHGDRRRARPQRPAARAATGSPTTTSS